MTVTIKVPEQNGDITSAAGTKIYTQSGQEIKEVTRIRVDWTVNDTAEATIDVCVTPGMSMDNVHALLGTETLEQIAEMHGYALKPIEGTE